ncbi:glycoside hydrolase family 43 protein [Parapedobacter sp. 10938]|uniref:glycoside hydrolase family 43 protein n=1 Tax=Parapedobacter flavus TaxID=3110225 RepID=UPI002DBA155B|nr:glycoside hydrolase family 43 protein [Parapedobacter sp. 10938]MEC3878009.1 glycoside hydrolase family 43 protein [Parapedobacter sp. 10938]
MNFFVLTIASLVFGCMAASAQHATETIHISDLHIRDPYIIADKETQTYFLYKSAPVGSAETRRSGVVVFKSKDLENWEGPYTVFTTPDDNWITGAIWAPEVHQYKGKYYLFATLNSDIEWKKKREDWPRYSFRGTQLFYADSPMGPFLPFDGKRPHTPMDWMALDGTLWVEDDKPYMIFCHEWVEVEDGTMELIELEHDLSAVKGQPLTLFNASSAPWSTGSTHDDGTVSYVTDGCFLYRTKTGKLLMIWSSFKEGQYAIGIAESTTGQVAGPWQQQEDVLFAENGGHGMLFESFDGTLMLTFHGPNSPGGAERAQIFTLSDEGNTLRLGKRLY